VAHSLIEGWYLPISCYDKKPWNAHVSSLSAFWPGLQVSIGNVRPAAELHVQYYTIWSYYEAIPDITNLVNSRSSNDGTSYPLRPELIESTYYLF
jgi:hypothetical protein